MTTQHFCKDHALVVSSDPFKNSLKLSGLKKVLEAIFFSKASALKYYLVSKAFSPKSSRLKSFRPQISNQIIFRPQRFSSQNFLSHSFWPQNLSMNSLFDITTSLFHETIVLLLPVIDPSLRRWPVSIYRRVPYQYFSCIKLLRH